MAVTSDQVLDPLTVGPDDQADSGQRFVGVWITLKNVGTTAYSDSPSNGATLLSTGGEQANSAIVSGGPCGSGFGSAAKIAPGEGERGCLAFQMPVDQRLGEFQFTLSSGFADQTGEWTLAGAPVASGSTSPNGRSATQAVGRTQCDPNISAGSRTSCPFAENVFRAVAAGHQQNGQIPPNVTAKSPTTGTTYSLSCNVDGASDVLCSTSSGAAVTFSLHSVQVY
jgi:hypothetical protein